MAVGQHRSQAVTALNRFGLGARGDMNLVAGDLRAFLLEELRRANIALIRDDALPSGSKALQAFYLDQQAKLEAFAAADVVVLPSRSEASPVVLFEALLCRRPAIVSSACELPMSQPEAHGVLQFESLNARELRDRLLFALTDPHLSDNAAVGHNFVLREFSPKVVAEKAERIYEEAVFRKSRPPQM